VKKSACIALLAVFTGGADAAILYSNISPGFLSVQTDSYGSGSNFTGTTFVTTAGGLLGQVAFGVEETNPSITATAALYADSSGEPGTLLESWTFLVPTTKVLTTLDSVVHPAISSGAQYWFVFSGFPTDSNSFEVWGNDTGILGGFYDAFSLDTLGADNFDPTSFHAPGIQLTDATVPEPSALGFLAAGCIAIIGLRRVFR
jgi:hypothetical protein